MIFLKTLVSDALLGCDLKGTPEGRQMQALIIEVTPEYIILDLNHPLAGKALTFKIKVIKITH